MRDLDQTQPASKSDLEYLRQMGYPELVVQFFGKESPTETIDINGVRIYPVADIREENEMAIPGYVIVEHGYLNIASTEYGDTYCVDLNTKNAKGEPRIVLVGHDKIEEDMDPGEITDAIIPIADSFDEFLTRFKNGDLPSDYWDCVEN